MATTRPVGNLRLTSISFAHPAVEADRRAGLSLVGDSLRRAHRRLRGEGSRVFVLSTCLRVELAWTASPDIAPALLATLYGDVGPSAAGVVREDEEAFRHLCRVAAGLDSPLVGEPEVLGQFRQAVALLQEEDTESGALDRVLEAAIGIARTTRRSLDEPARGSLAAAAAREAAPYGRVAILGGGAMARSAAEHLEGVDLTIFARRPGTVAGHPAAGWGAVPHALATFPAVISTVPGKGPLLGTGVVARALADRSGPLLLVDLGMPPGFARPAGDSVSYLGVDAIASLVGSRAPAAAEERAATDADLTWRRLTAPDRAGAVIAAMVGQAESAVAEEVQRFAKRLTTADDPEQVLRQVAHTVARRLLHSPIAYLGSSPPAAIDVLAEAFGVADD